MKPVSNAKPNPVRIHVVHQHHHHYSGPVTHNHQHTHAHFDRVSHVHRAAVPTMARRSVAMVSVGTQTEAPQPASPENWMAYTKRHLRKLIPVVEFFCAVTMFIMSRINFGFGFRVPWLPGIGFGAN